MEGRKKNEASSRQTRNEAQALLNQAIKRDTAAAAHLGCSLGDFLFEHHQEVLKLQTRRYERYTAIDDADCEPLTERMSESPMKSRDALWITHKTRRRKTADASGMRAQQPPPPTPASNRQRHPFARPSCHAPRGSLTAMKSCTACAAVSPSPPSPPGPLPGICGISSPASRRAAAASHADAAWWGMAGRCWGGGGGNARRRASEADGAYGVF